MTVRAIDHGVALELDLARTPQRWDRVSAWLLPGGLLVDAGGAHTAPELLGELGARGLRAEAVFIGHWHEDHAGGAARLAAAGAVLHGGRATAARLRRPPAIPGYRSDFWGQIEAVRLTAVPTGGPLRAIPLPGHSADQLGYLDERTGVLYSGDLALRRFQRVSMRGEDPHAMIGSIRLVLGLGPEALATSHRGLLREWRGYLEEQLDYLESSRERVRRLRREGRRVGEIVAEVYGGEAAGPDGRSWREFSGGEFSTARWVATLLRDRGSAAAGRSSRSRPRP